VPIVWRGDHGASKDHGVGPVTTDEQLEGAAGVAHRDQSRRVPVPDDGPGRKAGHVAGEAVADTQVGGAALVGLLAALRTLAEHDEAEAYGHGVTSPGGSRRSGGFASAPARHERGRRSARGARR
jgi:hypothetical protein